MGHYRKKPIVIEAIQYDGTTESEHLILSWVDSFNGDAYAIGPDHDRAIEIRTLEGMMQAIPGDWVIRGLKDEFYPCKPDIFDATYEVA
jgi:hypothetical protein